MAQESVAPETSYTSHGNKSDHSTSMLGPILCWAVVFADIGTSVYYTPGILYGTVGNLAGFFVFLTMSVFVLLTLKYVEVTHRFPQGGGVVTVASQAMNHWVGALGGMFILVDYFLTSAISSLSGMEYLSVVVPAIGESVKVPGLGSIQLVILLITVGVLILLGILNWVGISESARVSLVGAIIAFISDIAILITVFTHLSFSEFLSLFPKMFATHALTPNSILVGFAGSFLAFSGLESISQLSPVMKQPHKRVAGIAMLLVVLTIGITSPLLTMLSTILLPSAAKDPVQNTQIISLLAGRWGGMFLQTEVAISATALLVFASNTAIIGAYHVFIALTRMEFLPSFVLRRNKLRGTPHYAIALATGIPVVVLIGVLGQINLLGDMYAFGLLGAFTLTCLGLDIVRYRDWKIARATKRGASVRIGEDDYGSVRIDTAQQSDETSRNGTSVNGYSSSESVPSSNTIAEAPSNAREGLGLWFKISFFLGILTTLLVAIAWSTNLVTKPLATAFGGGVATLGMIIAYADYIYHEKKGRVPVPVVVTRIDEPMPNSVLAVLTASNGHNNAVIRAAVNNADTRGPLVFLYVGKPTRRKEAPSMMEIVDPYLDDEHAKEYFGRAESLALKAKVPTRRFVYLEEEPDIVAHAWQTIHPHDIVIAAEDEKEFHDVNPDRIRYELTSDGKVAHLLKTW